MWLAVISTGLGLELVLGEPLIKHLATSQSKVLGAWKIAQLWFAVCITVALFSQSAFGFPFMIVGFWKFGFPETFGCYRRAFRIGMVNVESVCSFLDGVGTLIHHTTGAYWIIACTTGLQPFDRRILALSLPLVGQHIVVLTKYAHIAFYGICELCLEIFWQCEVYSNLNELSLENGCDITTRGAALCMLFAHWCYWSSALMGGVVPLVCRPARNALEEMMEEAKGDGLVRAPHTLAAHATSLCTLPAHI